MIGILIIGDEILSGKRQDKHFAKAVEILGARGLELAWAQYLGDDPAFITATLRRTLATTDIVFSFGGIGATPDDHTRQCAAAALGRELAAHPDGLKELEARFPNDPAQITPHRVNMVTFPVGSSIIPNPFNRIPGFSVNSHYFVPGFPEMAWPMMEWVLDTKYAHLHRAVKPLEEAIIVQVGESKLIDIMDAVVRDYPDLKLASLPQNVDGGYRVELSVRGDPARVPIAMAYVRAEVAKLGYDFTDRPPRR
ncbi:competence/damage-inducible protein A [Usitatibacter palustris]|uniref:Nicotinamide-nucleotide amidohydrolase PncC n=1 Tax=Usitatibacter palustris TaxID=2732487 RepID=A0A6M4HAI5_9PROT|nr:molybdopterin-binding protein [Usitatibacter palustris]QJR16145.1 Nicotinamide-nucleotide amidohydrolase PncC [Usitatibacter palustris]